MPSIVAAPRNTALTAFITNRYSWALAHLSTFAAQGTIAIPAASARTAGIPDQTRAAVLPLERRTKSDWSAMTAVAHAVAASDQRGHPRVAERSGSTKLATVRPRDS